MAGPSRSPSSYDWTLPAELWKTILRFSEMEDRDALRRTCRLFRELMDRDVEGYFSALPWAARSVILLDHRNVQQTAEELQDQHGVLSPAAAAQGASSARGCPRAQSRRQASSVVQNQRALALAGMPSSTGKRLQLAHRFREAITRQAETIPLERATQLRWAARLTELFLGRVFKHTAEISSSARGERLAINLDDSVRARLHPSSTLDQVWGAICAHMAHQMLGLQSYAEPRRIGRILQQHVGQPWEGRENAPLPSHQAVLATLHGWNRYLPDSLPVPLAILREHGSLDRPALLQRFQQSVEAQTARGIPPCPRTIAQAIEQGEMAPLQILLASARELMGPSMSHELSWSLLWAARCGEFAMVDALLGAGIDDQALSRSGLIDALLASPLEAGVQLRQDQATHLGLLLRRLLAEGAGITPATWARVEAAQHAGLLPSVLQELSALILAAPTRRLSTKVVELGVRSQSSEFVKWLLSEQFWDRAAGDHMRVSDDLLNRLVRDSNRTRSGAQILRAVLGADPTFRLPVSVVERAILTMASDEVIWFLFEQSEETPGQAFWESICDQRAMIRTIMPQLLDACTRAVPLPEARERAAAPSLTVTNEMVVRFVEGRCWEVLAGIPHGDALLNRLLAPLQEAWRAGRYDEAQVERLARVFIDSGAPWILPMIQASVQQGARLSEATRLQIYDRYPSRGDRIRQGFRWLHGMETSDLPRFLEALCQKNLHAAALAVVWSHLGLPNTDFHNPLMTVSRPGVPGRVLSTADLMTGPERLPAAELQRIVEQLMGHAPSQDLIGLMLLLLTKMQRVGISPRWEPIWKWIALTRVEDVPETREIRPYVAEILSQMPQAYRMRLRVLQDWLKIFPGHRRAFGPTADWDARWLRPLLIEGYVVSQAERLALIERGFLDSSATRTAGPLAPAEAITVIERVTSASLASIGLANVNPLAAQIHIHTQVVATQVAMAAAHAGLVAAQQRLVASAATAPASLFAGGSAGMSLQPQEDELLEEAALGWQSAEEAFDVDLLFADPPTAGQGSGSTDAPTEEPSRDGPPLKRPRQQ